MLRCPKVLDLFFTAGTRGACVPHAAAATNSWRCMSGPLFNSGLADEEPAGPYEAPLYPPTYIVHKKGQELLHDPWFNKGTAFPLPERDRLGIRGLVPPKILTLEKQKTRFMDEYEKPREIPPEESRTGGVTSEMARRWRLLQALQDRNETLFFKVLIDNFVDMAPIIYTPTVGWVCLNYHVLYRRPRGMFFSAADKGEMAAMAWNWPQHDVSAIVVTDGSRILGLGDLGVNGLGIPVGKLDLYCAAAGFSPSRVLPVVIDVGTDNKELREDPLYAGLKHPRIRGREYYQLIDEFVAAVMSRWPRAVLQFEDFSTEHALVLLNRYRNQHLVFNDDIQGTAATALAGLYGALRVLGLKPDDLAKQRFVCVGAGSAGMGVVKMIASSMIQAGLSEEEAYSKFWVVDHMGLISDTRMESLPEHVKPFAKAASSEPGGNALIEVVKRVKPTILLGLAGAGRIFTESVIKAFDEGCPDQRPIIFPMSNPISKMECTSEEAVRATKGRAIFASGSPQPEVLYEGKTVVASQANNMYIFPGVALGAFIGDTRTITDSMLMRAAVALPSLISEQDLAKGFVYPNLAGIRDISTMIALEVIKQAGAENRIKSPKALEMLKKGDAKAIAWIKACMFVPTYSSLVQLPVGVYE